MNLISVGQPFPSATPIPAHDFIFADLSSDGRLWLLSQMNRMTGREKQEVLRGTFKAHAWTLDIAGVPICGLLARIGGLHWLDSTIFVNSPERRQAGLSFVRSKPNGLEYYVLDQAIVKRIGFFGLSREDCDLLAESFRQQMQRGILKTQWDAAVATCYRHYTTEDLVSMSVSKSTSTGDVPFVHPSTQTSYRLPSEVIWANLGGWLDLSKQYPTLLLSELAQWYCYPLDVGHSILVLIRKWYRDGMTFSEAAPYMVPAPVSMVMRGYSLMDGLVVVDVPFIGDQVGANVPLPYYSTVLGLRCSAGDYEY